MEVTDVLGDDIEKTLKDPLDIAGVDYGVQMLKFTWSVSTNDSDIKSNSVKCCLVFAAGMEVPETYHNLQVIWKLTKLDSVSFKFIGDLNVYNIVLGMPL